MFLILKTFFQHLKFMNWRIGEFVFWCHEQVNGSVKITIIKILPRRFEARNVCIFYFNMNLLRKINQKYIHMRRVQCNDSSMLFRKEDIFASHKWSKRGLSEKKITRCQALFFFVFRISFPIFYCFWVSLLIPHQAINFNNAQCQYKTHDKFWI